MPRTAAPLVLALPREGSGGHGTVPWLLACFGALAAIAFHAAVQQFASTGE